MSFQGADVRGRSPLWLEVRGLLLGEADSSRHGARVAAGVGVPEPVGEHEHGLVVGQASRR